MKTRLHIDHIRFVSTSEESASLLFLDGIYECMALEDQPQPPGVKVYGETRIPAGDYFLRLRTSNSRMHLEYKAKFPFHVGMLEIVGIPSYGDVYYHIGNRDKETLGCPLVADKLTVRDLRMVTEFSTLAYEAFYKKVAPVLVGGGTVSVAVRDKDVNLIKIRQ